MRTVSGSLVESRMSALIVCGRAVCDAMLKFGKNLQEHSFTEDNETDVPLYLKGVSGPRSELVAVNLATSHLDAHQAETRTNILQQGGSR